MKFHDPRVIAIMNASAVTAAYIILNLFSSSILHPASFSGFAFYGMLLATSVLLFALTFFFFRYTVDKFIYSRIRLIYKVIYSVKTRKMERQKFNTGKISLDNVEKEVADWGAEKQKEIERLKQLEEYRKDFIGNISHELKTPLFNVQGYVSTLIEGGLDDPSINKEYLRRTEVSVERLIKIVEDLGEIAQLESGHLTLNKVRFDIMALTREVVEMLEMKAHDKEVQVTINQPVKPFLVHADREKIRQVLTNIIDNSLRYSLESGGRTKISFFDMDENILVEVTDNGIGIDQDDLPRVFERFYRTPRGRETSNKGKGLGLAIVKHIIEAHRQTINVRSTVGVGTTFGFTLRKA
ncbi:MAG: ATP-binding protein [Bacteroidota bacterium]|jgi:two-component system, OmpR family, phosphate regulon sensor histidine kinase PhoR